MGLMSRLGQGLGRVGFCPLQSRAPSPCRHFGPGSVLPPRLVAGRASDATPALASRSSNTALFCSHLASASPLAKPWREGAPELLEAAGPAQRGSGQCEGFMFPDIFSLNRLLLFFLFNANLESVSWEKWTIARKKI